MAIGFTPKHTETISINNLNQQQLLALVFETAQQLQWKISYVSNSGIIAFTNNGMFKFNAQVTIKINNSDVEIESASTGREMYDMGRNKKTVHNYINQLNLLENSIKPEELTEKYEQLSFETVDSTKDLLSSDYIPNPADNKSFLSLLIPSKDFFVTPLLIDINLVLFILMVVSGVNFMTPDTTSLLNWGANFRPSTLAGEWWRLITNCFLHIGVIHLLLNMYALLYIGVLLEPILGRARFFTAYILTGVAASVASLWWHDLTVSAGASGAIFGMYGVFLALLTTNLIEKNARQELLASISIFVGYNLIYGLKGGIDNAAHIGGLVSGLLIGYALIPSLKNYEDKSLQTKTLSALTVAVIAIAVFACKTISNDIGIYDEKMKTFADMEEKALKVYKLPQGSSNSEYLAAIKDSGIYYWSESLKLLNSMDKLELPKQLKERIVLYKEYCNLRNDCYKLMYKAIEEDTDNYKQELEDINKKVELKINELNKLNKE